MQLIVQSWIVPVLYVLAPCDSIGNFTTFEGRPLDALKAQFPKGTLDFNLECIQMLENVFDKQRYITFDATIYGEYRIDPKTHLSRTFLLGIRKVLEKVSRLTTKSLISQLF